MNPRHGKREVKNVYEWAQASVRRALGALAMVHLAKRLDNSQPRSATSQVSPFARQHGLIWKLSLVWPVVLGKKQEQAELDQTTPRAPESVAVAKPILIPDGCWPITQLVLGSLADRV